MHDRPVITRFAPSPTGHLHIGGARTALFCWAFARRHAGRFLLRIEDTDQARSSEDAARGILEDLAWLGIGWDDGPLWVDGPSDPNVCSGGQAVGSSRRPAQYGGDARGVGPYYQSQRRDIYEREFVRLLEAGLAYPAFETPEELGAMRKAAEAEKKTFIYRQRGDYDHAAALARVRRGEAHVLRLKMPGQAITVHDRVLGDVTFPAEELDDFVIRKADGFPTYHFAVVVDDELMGVTHVLRGQEHLNNTPRHIALQRALGFRTPFYAHMPLIFNLDATKMSKRDKDKAAKKAVRDAGIESVAGLVERLHSTGRQRERAVLQSLSDADLQVWLKDKQRQLGREQVGAVAAALGLKLPEIDVEDFRAAGYLPEVLCNFIALLGWNPGERNADGTDLERFDQAFLASRFDTDRIGKTNSKFDREKLLAFNADTIQHGLTDERFAGLWLGWAERFDEQLATWARADAARWQVASRAARPRTKTLSDAREAIGFALVPDDAVVFDDKAVGKVLHKGEPSGLVVLEGAGKVLASVDPWAPEAIDAALHAFATDRGLGMGKVAQPLRVAVTGGSVSPGLGETLALIGREGTLRRVERCLMECRGSVI
ncbi:MAG: glutamate--tRNA ligase [Phycisphaerales bacterium]|nr:glutamate--tRNA ligase [Phycisphaerales bacterium]